MNRILLKHISLVGLNLNGYSEREPQTLERTQRELFALYERGALRPLIHATYPLERAATALAELDSRRTTGKLILSS